MINPMQPHVAAMPGYRVMEYMLVLNPHDELRNRINQLKKEFGEAYDCVLSTRGKAHLALARFSQLEGMEEKIINKLKLVAMSWHPFKVELKNFGSLPSHSVFINVPTKEPVKELVRQIRPWQRLLKLDNDHKPHFIDDPHIIIASRLIPWQYEKAWLEYSNKHFTGRFIASGMLLLKRRKGEKAWQIAHSFEFQNLPVLTRQGELFS